MTSTNAGDDKTTAQPKGNDTAKTATADQKATQGPEADKKQQQGTEKARLEVMGRIERAMGQHREDAGAGEAKKGGSGKSELP